MKENEILPPKEHINSNKTYKNSQNLALRILVVLIFLGGTFLLIKLFPGIRPIKTDQFIEIVDAAGYTANDTSTTLSQNWKVGSMLKEAYRLTMIISKWILLLWIQQKVLMYYLIV